MSIVYDGSHSITFIKTGSNNAVTTKKTWVDWHLVPDSRPIVNPPQPSLSMLSIPGNSKILDMTEVLGSVSFSTRTGEWEFLVDNDYWDDWVDAYNTIMMWINGSKLQCVLDDDPTTIYTGRFVFGAWKTGASYSSCTIQYTLEYYTEEATLTSISATFNQNGRVLNSSVPKEAFREGLTVTANYSSGVSYVVKDYEIASVGIDDIIVSYGGDTTVVLYSPTAPIIIGLEAVYRQPIEDIYPSASLNSLKEDLAVFNVYNTGEKEAVSSSDYSLSGTLSVGKSTVTVTSGNKTATFDVWVSEPKLTSISATFNQGNTVYYAGGDLQSLKSKLVVKAVYSDGVEQVLSPSVYILKGILFAGNCDITVEYNNKTTFFTVDVTPVLLDSISAEFSGSQPIVYTSSSLDFIKRYIVVEATYNNGDEAIIDREYYTLSGTLTVGSSTITVLFGNKTTTFVVSVTPVNIVSIEATYNGRSHTVYETDSLDSLRPYLMVVGEYNDGNRSEINEYTLSGTLTSGTSNVIVLYMNKSSEFSVQVMPTNLLYINATFAPGSRIFYNTDTLNELKPYLTVFGAYNNGDVTELNDYYLSGDLGSEESIVIVAYGNKTATISVSVTIVDVSSISAVFNQGDNVVFSHNSLDSLRQYLTVTATYQNNKTREIDSGYTLSGTLESGSTSTITVVYKEKSTTFNVDVSDLIIVDFDVYSYNGSKFYQYDTYNDIKDKIYVVGTYNDGISRIVSLEECEISVGYYGHLYTSNTWISAKIGSTTEVLVTNVIPASYIEPNYTPQGILYEGSVVNILEDRLEPEYVYEDGIRKPVDDYELYVQNTDSDNILSPSGDLLVEIRSPSNFIQHCYGSFVVNVVAVVMESISATFDQGDTIIIPIDSLDSLKQLLTVTARMNDGTTYDVDDVDDYSLSGDLTAGTSTITVSYNGKTTTFSVIVTSIGTSEDDDIYFVDTVSVSISNKADSTSTSFFKNVARSTELGTRLENEETVKMLIRSSDTSYPYYIGEYYHVGSDRNKHLINEPGAYYLSDCTYRVTVYNDNYIRLEYFLGIPNDVYDSGTTRMAVRFDMYAVFPKDGDS